MGGVGRRRLLQGSTRRAPDIPLGSLTPWVLLPGGPCVRSDAPPVCRRVHTAIARAGQLDSPIRARSFP
jgi:hypothetical protein